MKTKQILLAFFFAAGILPTLLDAQVRRMYGFGMGLTSAAGGEIISYIARESPLHDFDIQQGDKIIAIDGKPIGSGVDVPVLANAFGTDSILLQVEQNGAGKADTISFTLVKTLLRRDKIERCGMFDPSIGYVRVSAFDDTNVDTLEAMLDSLAKGNNGLGTTADIAYSREAEARTVFFCQNPGFSAQGANEITGNDPRAYYQSQIESYIQQKYAWQMQTLMIDMRGNPSAFSRDVMRSIRLFCKERNIALVCEF